MTSEGISLHANSMTEQEIKTDANQEAQPPVTHTGRGGLHQAAPKCHAKHLPFTEKYNGK